MKKVLYVVFFLLIVAAGLGITRSWFQYRQLSLTQAKKPEGVDSIFYLTRRKGKTAVLMRGNNLKNPILIMIHGGPGYPDMMLSRCYDQGLLDEFTVIRYDQSGAGKSQHPEVYSSSLTIEKFTEELLLLTDALKEQVPNVDIYLLGHSWGTVIGLKALFKAPEKYKAYIGMGQIVDENRGDKMSYHFTLDKARKAQNEKAIKELLTLNPENYNRTRKQLMLQRKYLKQFGGSSHKPDVLDDLKACALKSPEMDFMELLNYQTQGQALDQLIFPQLLSINFFEQIQAVKRPLFIFGGRYDYHVPSILAEKYLDQVEAPHKEFIWFEESGHMPVYEENEKFVKELIRIKKEVPLLNQ